MKKKKTTKIKPIGKRKETEQVYIQVPPFHESFPLTLLHKKDKEKKVCYFQCKEHMDSYMKRNKLASKDVTIQPTVPKVIETEEDSI